MRTYLLLVSVFVSMYSISPVSAAPHGSPAWLKIENALPPLPEGFRGVGWCTRLGDIPWKLSGGTVHTLYTREDENFTIFGATAKYITYTSRNSVLYGVRIDIAGRDNVLEVLEAVKKDYPPAGAVEQVNPRESRWSTRYTSLWVTLPEEPGGLGQVYLWGRDRVFPDDSKTPVYLNKPKELNYTLKKYKPRHYVIYRASGPVTIDGSINEKAWQDAQWTDAFEDAQSPYCPLPWKMTRAKILYDDKNLYVAARLQEENVWGHITQRDSIVYYDNDFEIFVDPTANAVNYYEYEMTCLNTMFDMWHENDNYRGALADGRYDAPGLRSAVQVQGTLNFHYDTDEGWTAEVMIPLADMKMKNPEMSLPIKRGDQWRMNFSRVEYLHIYTQPFPYLLPYSPCEDWVWNTTHIGDLHIPEMWAKVTFSNLYAGTVHDEALEGGPPILPPPSAPKERKKDMVHFPACTMTLGPDPTDPVHSPAHTVQVPEFWMDRYEVTLAEFTQFLNRGGNDNFFGDKMMNPELCGIICDAPGKYHVIPGRENYPVVFVNHDAALAYAQSLGKTLPTEAMFERAARGLDGRRYPWGNEPLNPNRANYDFHFGGTLQVGSLPNGATPEGIYDLLGNVKEWTDSRLTPYPRGAKFAYWFNFPFFAPPFGDVPANWVNRGGGWTKQEKCMEIGYRDTEAAHNCGFRCVKLKKS
jgi:formylglycine-generating enzyme required for sulfatase activity